MCFVFQNILLKIKIKEWLYRNVIKIREAVPLWKPGGSRKTRKSIPPAV